MNSDSICTICNEPFQNECQADCVKKGLKTLIEKRKMIGDIFTTKCVKVVLRSESNNHTSCQII